MSKERTLGRFLRKNAAYIVLALCVIAIGVSLTLVMVNRTSAIKNEMSTVTPVTEQEKTPDPEPENPVVTPDPEPETPVVSVITFLMPVENAISIGDYTETLTYNTTLKRYETHKAIDIFAEEGAAVLAVYDGTVESVDTTLLTGTTVVIDHGNGLKTVYNSLLDGEDVTVGKSVKKGDKIGEVSVSNRQEAAVGAHLHFAVTENGETINPSKYLEFGEK